MFHVPLVCGAGWIGHIVKYRQEDRVCVRVALSESSLAVSTRLYDPTVYDSQTGHSSRQSAHYSALAAQTQNFHVITKNYLTPVPAVVGNEHLHRIKDFRDHF